MAKHFINAISGAVMLLAAGLSHTAMAQSTPVTGAQRATATQVAQNGVALSELNPNAPSSHTVKSGDTLWGISSLFLKSAWRWPELWGMNLEEIKNPHRIYPGQTLYLDQSNGRARLSLQQTNGNHSGLGSDTPIPTVKVSPRTRAENLSATPLPTLKNQVIEAFLAEPVVVDDLGLSSAPRIVAAQDSRVLLTRGDRAYARGQAGDELMDDPSQRQKLFRVFRNATPLKDPTTAEVLGYEAQYVGKARLVKSESTQTSADNGGDNRTLLVPATIDIIDAKEEMRVGDRLLPEPPQTLQSYVPRAPASTVNAQVVSVYGSAVANAAQNQVVTINRGTRDGMEVGHVLAIMKAGLRLVDKTSDEKTELKLPDERNGLMMVFRTYERVSYALVLDITSGVKVGDHLINPN